MTTRILKLVFLNAAGGDRQVAMKSARRSLEIKESTGDRTEIRVRFIQDLKEVIKQLEKDAI